MIFKKLLLILCIGLIPAQSLALTNDQKAGMVGFLGAATCLFAGFGYLLYRDYQKEKAERELWNNKTDDEMAALVTKFTNKIEKRLASQLKKLRKIVDLDESYTVKGNLKCFYFIRRTINKCDTWLKRLQNRDLVQLVEKIQHLKSELVQLNDRLNIYIDKDLIESFERFENKQPSAPMIIPIYTPGCYPYHY